jgi:hypothetical protein
VAEFTGAHIEARRAERAAFGAAVYLAPKSVIATPPDERLKPSTLIAIFNEAVADAEAHQ